MSLMKKVKIILAGLYAMFVSVGNLQGQCHFNCNDTINVSVNAMCEAFISSDMLLEAFEANAPSCSYTIELRDQSGRTINSAPRLTSVHVDQYITATIFLTSNPALRCQSILKIEDKLPPEVFCIGRDTLDCTTGSDIEILRGYIKTQIERDLVDNCGNRTVDINIMDVRQTTCTSGFSTTRIVEYAVTQNNVVIKKSCRDTFYYRELDLSRISPPKNYQDNAALPCTGPYPTVQHLLGSANTHREQMGLNALPNIDGRSLFDLRDSLFVERGLCNLKMTYSDQILESCGAAYKIVRTWVILDWCSGGTRIMHQVIKVVDNNVMITSGCAAQRGLSANPSTCTAMVTLSSPSVAANECSSWSYTIFVRDAGASDFVAFGGTRNPGSNVARPFPIGTSRVRYVVRDVCNNTAQCEFDIEVRDTSEPRAICDGETVVALNDDLVGKVFARSIDDGSFDECGSIVSMKIRRMDRATSSCGSSLDWDDSVKFCCEDIGKIIMVELQVIDDAGYSNICMAEVHVQYKGAGPQINCGAEITTQNCDLYDTYDINTLAPPTITTNNTCIANALVPQVREKARNINICGNGFIDVEWVLNYTGVEQVICTKRIQFAPVAIFNLGNIRWPADRIVNSCIEAPATQAEKDNLIQQLPCSNVIASEPIDTRIFTNVGEACKRIQRTWTVVDWCRFPADPTARWTHVQTITLSNTSPPRFETNVADIVIQEDQSNCRAFVDITGLATDECLDIAELTWTYKLDIVDGANAITIINTTAGRTLSRALDFGQYRISFTVTDDCGNSAVASRDFALRDKTPPLVSCNSLVRDIPRPTADSTIILTLTARDFVSSITDNCDSAPSTGIRRAGSTGAFLPLLNFTCQDLGVRQVEVSAIDAAGNVSSCISFVDIRDGNASCGFGAGMVRLSGEVKTGAGIPVEKVDVSLGAGLASRRFNTSHDGSYAFEELRAGQNLQVLAKKNDDYTNGVSTLDLVLIQRHILGVRPFDNAASYIAADVNGSQSITSSDLVLIRRLLLGLIDALPGGASWIFVPENKMPKDLVNPWIQTSAYHIDNIQSDMIGANFRAIKLGDIDQNAIANSKIARPRSLSTYDFVLKNEGSSIAIYPTGAQECSGMQLALRIGDIGRIKDIGSTLPRFDSDMIHIKGDMIYLTWYNSTNYELDSDIAILHIDFYDKIASGVVELNANWSNELYTSEYVAKQIVLRPEIEELEGFKLFQNFPNPFNEETTIDYYLAETGLVEFNIINMNGEIIHRSSVTQDRGSHSMKINRVNYNLNKGIYYYMIKTQHRSLTKKMVVF